MLGKQKIFTSASPFRMSRVVEPSVIAFPLIVRQITEVPRRIRSEVAIHASGIIGVVHGNVDFKLVSRSQIASSVARLSGSRLQPECASRTAGEHCEAHLQHNHDSSRLAPSPKKFRGPLGIYSLLNQL